MDDKTEAIRREILKSIVERYGHLEKKTVVHLVKSKGVYKNYVGDDEVYELVRKFAEYHNLPFGYVAPEDIPAIPLEVKTVTIVPFREENEEIDHFYESMKEEHSRLSKKILALNKLMELYKSNTHETKKTNKG